jgi:hypothetical protein
LNSIHNALHVHVIDITLKQYLVYITNVDEFILQVTRALYFSQLVQNDEHISNTEWNGIIKIDC